MLGGCIKGTSVYVLLHLAKYLSNITFIYVLGYTLNVISKQIVSYKTNPRSGVDYLVFSIDTDNSVAAIVTGVLLVLTITHLTIPPD